MQKKRSNVKNNRPVKENAYSKNYTSRNVKVSNQKAKISKISDFRVKSKVDMPLVITVLTKASLLYSNVF